MATEFAFPDSAAKAAGAPPEFQTEKMSVEGAGTYTSGKPEPEWPGRGRLAIKALNEAGYNCTEVDLLELLAWVKANRPDLMA